MKIPWYSVYSFLSFYFCLEPTLRKDIWMRISSVTRAILKVTWSQLCSKSLLNKYEVCTLTAAVCKTSYSLRFYVRGTKFMLILLSRLENKHHETKIDKADWKLSVEQAPEFALQKNCTKVDDISLVLIRFFFSQKT